MWALRLLGDYGVSVGPPGTVRVHVFRMTRAIHPAADHDGGLDPEQETRDKGKTTVPGTLPLTG